MDYSSMNGRYFSTCWNDIKSSEGWFARILLLGLLQLVPIFGQIVLLGFAYEWAHKAAWGVSDSLPKKIFGRPGSKMLRWGWFALVIAIVMSLIPMVVSFLGSFVSGFSTGVAMSGSHHGYAAMGGAGIFGSLLGGLISLASIVLSFAAAFAAWVGNVRMVAYDSLGAGLQFKQLWKMAKHDFGGLLRIFGMTLLLGLIAGVVFCVLFIVVFSIFGIGLVGFIGNASSGTGAAEFAVMALMAIFPLLLVLGYVAYAYTAFTQLMTARAVGYWARQFRLAEWGTKDDALPFEKDPAGAAMPQQPAAPQGAAQPSQPAAPRPEDIQQPVAAPAAQPVAASAEAASQPGDAQTAVSSQLVEPVAETAPQAEAFKPEDSAADKQ